MAESYRSYKEMVARASRVDYRRLLAQLWRASGAGMFQGCSAERLTGTEVPPLRGALVTRRRCR